MPNAYQSTQVPVAKSQEAIRKLLMQYGARGVQFYEDFETREINVRFAKEINRQLRTVSVSLKIPGADEGTTRRWSRTKRTYVYTTQADRAEQKTRATYRALHYWLKSQFEAVDYGLFSFEDVFLSHFEWMIDGKTTTVGALVKPKLEGNLLTTSKGSENDDIIEAEE